MKTQLDLVIFDCDGVLIDSEPIASRTMAETLTGHGIPMAAAEALTIFTGMSESDIRVDLRERGLADYDQFLVAWHERLFSAFSTELRPMDGIEALVGRIETPVCVASNSSKSRLKQSLGQTPLWKFFDPHVYSAEDVDHPKPAPDLVLHCLERRGARPEQSVMIDDSAHGILAARHAGVTPIGFVDPLDPRPERQRRLSEAGAEIVVTGAKELVPALQSLSVSMRNS